MNRLKKHERGRDGKRKRNNKGKLSSAKFRQIKKRTKQIKKKLNGGSNESYFGPLFV